MSSLKEKAKTFGTYHVECDRCGYTDTVQHWMHYCPKCQWLIKCWEEKWVRLEDVVKEMGELKQKILQTIDSLKELQLPEFTETSYQEGWYDALFLARVKLEKLLEGNENDDL
jgi:hypothetical protein